MSLKSLRVHSWWSSSTSLLHTIIKFTIPSMLLALLILFLGPFDKTLDHSVAQPSSPSRSQKADLLLASRTGNDEKADSESRLASLGIDLREAKTHSPLGDKITNWDQRRRSLLAPANGIRRYTNGRRPRPNILLVTGSSPRPCPDPLGDHLLLQFMKNKIDYCRLHGIDIFYNMALMNSQMRDCWSKLPLLRKLMLSHPEVEWIWWMDSDAAFTDMTFELPLEKYDQYNLVLHGWDDEVYVKRSWVGLNAGIFLIRNCQWSLDLMDVWALFGENVKVKDELGKFFSDFLTRRPVFEGDDQATLVYLLSTQRERWGKKVLLENSYFLHGYWEMIVDRYEKLMESSHAGYGDERWPFVTHFVGCKPCGPLAMDSKCAKQMERALNFADNQVLHQYGLEHVHLASAELVRYVNKTTAAAGSGGSAG